MTSCPDSSRPPSTTRRWKRSSLLYVSLLCLLLFSGVFANLTLGVSQVFAAPPKKPPVVPASLTLKQFLQQGRPDKIYRGAVAHVPQGIAAPHSSKDIPPNYSKLPPSAEPAKMTPIVQTLDSNLIAGAKTTGHVASGNGIVDLKGSDGRLEVQKLDRLTSHRRLLALGKAQRRRVARSRYTSRNYMVTSSDRSICSARIK